MRDAKCLKHYKAPYDPYYAEVGYDVKSTKIITDDESGIKYLPYEVVKDKYQARER